MEWKHKYSIKKATLENHKVCCKFYSRGLHVEGMRSSLIKSEIESRLARGIDLVQAHLDAPLVLSEQEDFQNERSVLEEIIFARGHILMLSPKCHPELAGLGIEYTWGKAKKAFRNIVNDCVGKNLHNNIMKSVSKDFIPLERVWKFARRTRDYRRAYKDLLRPDATEEERKTSYELMIIIIF